MDYKKAAENTATVAKYFVGGLLFAASVGLVTGLARKAADVVNG
jgi:hypothetical protein